MRGTRTKDLGIGAGIYIDPRQNFTAKVRLHINMCSLTFILPVSYMRVIFQILLSFSISEVIITLYQDNGQEEIQ